MKPLDIAGQRFGRLVAITPTTKRNGKKIIWQFKCDCGSDYECTAVAAKCGNTKSCGCGIGTTTHGQSKTPVYRVWCAMWQRCRNPSHPGYSRYGGRGITVCERWKSFEAFSADMGERPHGASLDRINNDGPYSPENCRWATTQIQQENRRVTIRLTINGRTQTLAEWAKEYGVGRSVLHYRVRSGWPQERWFYKPS